MKVFKFGGASVKDAEGVNNVTQILQSFYGEDVFVVISAMGKTTNAFEVVVNQYYKKDNYTEALQSILENHIQIVQTLFDDSSEIEQYLTESIEKIKDFLQRNKSPNYNYIYDQLVSWGELFSTKIVSTYIESQGIENTWLDAREYIKTDNTYREGQVDWRKTQDAIQQLEKGKLYITQGFIGSDENSFTTTLGREGSDYSASIFSYCLQAESLTIWKDVPGVLNADPRYFEKTTMLEEIPYGEAVELAYYGASVIHPKTLKPLENKGIPLQVKSFINPKEKGTIIYDCKVLQPSMPCYIIKKNQILLTISPKDFSFISEKHISELFDALSQHKVKVNLMQISAISLSLCVEDKFDTLSTALLKLKDLYQLHFTKDVSLYTIRHFTEASEKEITDGKKVLVKQINTDNLQIAVQEL